jgi:hypothetical protein
MSTENQNNSNLTIILDPIGRTILGERVENCSKEQECCDKTLRLKNPVVLHIVPADNQGKMSVQLLPLFFREFLADKSSDVVFTYQKDKIVVTDIEVLDFRLQGQYAQIFNPQNIFVGSGGAAPNSPNTGEAPKVVDLFDE